MIISFFEEFPDKRNLMKLELVKWKTKLYIAAPTLDRFLSIRRGLRKQKGRRKVIEYIYWPILDKKDGYWISPFSRRTALIDLFEDIKKNGKDIPVMIDAELPTTRNPWLYLTQLLNFSANKRLIRDFAAAHVKSGVYSCEYYPEGRLKESLFTFLGINFDPKFYGNRIIKMMYQSMHNFREDFLREEIKP